MNPRLQRGAAWSAVGHLILLTILVLGIPVRLPEQPPETEVEMQFVPSASQATAQDSARSLKQSSTPAPAEAPDVTEAPPAVQPPETKPIEAPPPPPPPPPAPPAASSTAAPAPPAAAPPPPSASAPAAPSLPPDVNGMLPSQTTATSTNLAKSSSQATQQAQTPPQTTPPQPTPTKQTPPSPVPVPSPPAPPPPTPSPPQQTAQPLPLPPVPVPPPPAPPTTTSQPNPTKNPAPESQALENTLERLRALQQQKQPPKAHANPQRGGAPNAGGSPNGNITDQLSTNQRAAIGDKVRECWTKDAGALDLDKMQVLLTVTTDAQGVARDAMVAPQDQGRLSDPRFRAFAERAVRAVMDARCANLPLPQDQLGAVRQLTFLFKPN
jgi:neural Wiskott-Aldrich syndrome protein